MTQPERANTSVPTVGDAVAEQVRTFRLRRGWSVRQLAEECAKLGAPQLTAASLGNIERGQDKNATRKRREVSVDELLILARALKVAPALLLFPVGEVPAIEVTPGWTLAAWTAFRWFGGTAFPDSDLTEHWAVPIYLFREHDRLNMLWTEAHVDGDEQRAVSAIHEMRRLRAEMQRHGLTPPVLDTDMAFVDERIHTYLRPEEAEAAVRRGATVRVVDGTRPGQGRVMQPGDPVKLKDAIDRGRQFAADFVAPEGGE